jgi:hypothetical protein
VPLSQLLAVVEIGLRILDKPCNPYAGDRVVVLVTAKRCPWQWPQGARAELLEGFLCMSRMARLTRVGQEQK